MGIATDAWPHAETDRQRRSILAAADRLLAGTPRRSTGNLSIVQLAAEADIKYWVIAQKHIDLRDHFQALAAKAKNVPAAYRGALHARDKRTKESTELRERCSALEQLVNLYATAINELALENQVLREQSAGKGGTVTPLPIRRPFSDQHP